MKKLYIIPLFLFIFISISWADPVVVDRMRLWALALLASLIAAGTAALCQALGVPMGGTRVGLWLSCVAALSAGTFLLLAFLPPSSYLERVRRRTAADARVSLQ